jgi:hypothetical protein
MIFDLAVAVIFDPVIATIFDPAVAMIFDPAVNNKFDRAVIKDIRPHVKILRPLWSPKTSPDTLRTLRADTSMIFLTGKTA